MCVCVEECWEITFSVSAVRASFLSRQIALLRELLLGWQSHLSLRLYSPLSPSFSLSHPTCLFSVNLLRPIKAERCRTPPARTRELGLLSCTSPRLGSPPTQMTLIRRTAPTRQRLLQETRGRTYHFMHVPQNGDRRGGKKKNWVNIQDC